jgi:hypothetical protein
MGGKAEEFADEGRGIELIVYDVRERKKYE